MNLKFLIIGAVILTGVATALFLPNGKQNASQTPEHDLLATAPEGSVPLRALNGSRSPSYQEATAYPVTVAPAVPVSAWARLAEKYGPEKTALSSKITSNLTSVINDGIELAGIAARNSGSASIAEAASKEILRSASGKLSLTEDQRQQASGVLQSAVNRRLVAVGDLTHAMTTEPANIMEMLLAGDALARQQISQSDYDSITQPTRAMLQQISGFIMGQPGAGGAAQLLMDADTTAELNAILTPDQQIALAEMTAAAARQLEARQAARSQSGSPFQIGEVPIMELERLDQTVGSVQQMAEAARMMMEAMKGLREAKVTTR